MHQNAQLGHLSSTRESTPIRILSRLIPSDRRRFSRLAENPSVPFYVIVNPDSGPGGASQPDANYQGCVPQLKSFSNAKLVGYVPTGYGDRSQSDVDSDVSTYAGWDVAYSLDGIFFDEVSTDEDVLAKYTAYASTAKSSFADGNGFVCPTCYI